MSNAGLPQKPVWLLIRRTIEDNPKFSFFICNASASTKLKTLVWLSGMRWAIEQCFEETKTELGMDHYEVRKFMGWWGKKAPSITLSQLRVLIKVVLPLRKIDFDTVIRQIAWIQCRNHRAYLSHRRRRLREIVKDP